MQIHFCIGGFFGMLSTGGLSSQSARSHLAGDTLGGNVRSVFKVHRHGLDVQLFIYRPKAVCPVKLRLCKKRLFFLHVNI